jgi:hypothetical protein
MLIRQKNPAIVFERSARDVSLDAHWCNVPDVEQAIWLIASLWTFGLGIRFHAYIDKYFRDATLTITLLFVEIELSYDYDDWREDEVASVIANLD